MTDISEIKNVRPLVYKRRKPGHRLWHEAFIFDLANTILPFKWRLWLRELEYNRQFPFCFVRKND